MLPTINKCYKGKSGVRVKVIEINNGNVLLKCSRHPKQFWITIKQFEHLKLEEVTNNA